MLEHPATQQVRDFLGSHVSGPSPADLTAADVMRTGVVVVNQNRGIHECVSRMQHHNVDTLLVVDEAYMEFADEGQSLLPALDRLPNVAILRTFSKIYGLAGLRIGYGILPERLADYLWRVRLPFSLNILAEEAALAALSDDAFRRESLRFTREGRKLISRELQGMGCSVIPSQSNFIMFSPPAEKMTARQLHARLLERGMIIRGLGAYHLPDWLRVTVGREEENRFFLELCREFLRA